MGLYMERYLANNIPDIRSTLPSLITGGVFIPIFSKIYPNPYYYHPPHLKILREKVPKMAIFSHFYHLFLLPPNFKIFPKNVCNYTPTIRDGRVPKIS